MEKIAAQRKKSILIIDPADNVAIALKDLKKGERCFVDGSDPPEWIPLLDDIPFGHKLAIGTMKKNESVLKYGEEIGKMKTTVNKGGWIHTHNLYCERGGGK
ncbi:UxaA family hydrolase [Fictibacillus enclensis]|uniref:UxaA family hydrolase n=1 Tax=Fictibacillus enclensis TaxID=1017270 RepID=UPI0025A1D909|nr:UxaA family hydrolase [Fictibacillus enclensis]MDM5340447.1 UxaA family hydrolase [Fictibacillus enclensis]